MHPSSSFVGMSDDHNLMTSVYQLRGQLIDMAFDSSRLWKEEVADHRNVVRHLVSAAGLRSVEQQSIQQVSWRIQHGIHHSNRRIREVFKVLKSVPLTDATLEWISTLGGEHWQNFWRTQFLGSLRWRRQRRVLKRNSLCYE